MNIKDTFALTSLHITIKVISGIILNKVIAVYLGPSGLALIGQFQNFSSIVTGISNASIQTGIVKITAENRSIKVRQKTWSNALLISFTTSIITSITVFTFSEYIAEQIMHDKSHWFLIQVFAISIIFYSLNLHVLSILNGLGEIKLHSIINIFISIASLVIVSILSVYYKLEGAIIGIILTQSFVFIITYLFIYIKYKNSFFEFKNTCIDRQTIRSLLAYGMISFFSGAVNAITMLSIRWIIIDNSSIIDAGLWEAALRICIYFNMIFVLPISIYYLPKFSSSNASNDLLFLLKQALTFFIPLMSIGIFAAYFIKDTIITVLFTAEFSFVSKIILWVLLAEFLRVISSLFITLLTAKRKLKETMLNEALWAITFVSLASVFIGKYNLQGVSIAYLFAAAVYITKNIFSLRTYLKTRVQL